MNNLAKWSLLIGMGCFGALQLGWYPMAIYLGIFALGTALAMADNPNS